MQRKILIMGLPGAGKTILARIVAACLNVVHFNADEVRAHINKDLGFSASDRIEHATRMGWLCDQVIKTGGFAVADFICPTPETRRAFLQGGPALIAWFDRIEKSAFEDTNQMFVRPDVFDVHVTRNGTPDYWAEQVAAWVRPIFDLNRPTALFVGRYQPFHDGHKALIAEGLRRVGASLAACAGIVAPPKAQVLIQPQPGATQSAARAIGYGPGERRKGDTGARGWPRFGPPVDGGKLLSF
jgi:adenylylsulfate kinase